MYEEARGIDEVCSSSPIEALDSVGDSFVCRETTHLWRPILRASDRIATLSTGARNEVEGNGGTEGAGEIGKRSTKNAAEDGKPGGKGENDGGDGDDNCGGGKSVYESVLIFGGVGDVGIRGVSESCGRQEKREGQWETSPTSFGSLLNARSSIQIMMR